jgi:hypothetical protein
VREEAQLGVQSGPEPLAPAVAAPGPGSVAISAALGIPGVLSLQRTSGNRRTTALLLRQRVASRGLTAHLQFMRERRTALGSGTALTPEQIRVEELTLARMNETLRRDSRARGELPLVLYSRSQREVLAELGRDPAALGTLEAPAPPASEEYARRMAPFEALATQLRGYRTRSERLIHAPWEQRVWLVRENQSVQDVFNLLASRLMDWAQAHVSEPTREPAIVVLRRLAGQREIQSLFRAAQLVPLDAEAHAAGGDVSGWAVAARLLWGFVPVAGDLTDLGEAIAGWDTLEERPLTPAERAIMLLGALLPFVAGHALRRAGEGIPQAAQRLAAGGRRSAAEIEPVLRAAEAVGGDEAAVRAAVERIGRGEHLPAPETQRLRETARRVESAAEGPATGRPRPGEPPHARPGADVPGVPGQAVGLLNRGQVVTRALDVLTRLRTLPITNGHVQTVLRRIREGATAGSSNAQVLRVFDAAFEGIQNPRLYSEVVADLWAEARRVAPMSYNDAAVRLSARAVGGRVEDIATIPSGLRLGGDEFFQRYAGTGQRFLDHDAPLDHGATTHLIQDLVIDRAFQEAGIGMRAEQFRALLPQVTGTGGNVPLGDAVWRILWDSETGGLINRPEDLIQALRQVLTGLQ